MEDFWPVLMVSAIASLKILIAWGVAVAYSLNRIEIFIALFGGGMAGVFFFAFFGTRIRHYFAMRNRAKNKRINFKRIRTILKIWRKFGLVGIATLTPPFLTPPIGTILAVAFGERFNRILIAMAISFAVWCSALAMFGDQISVWLHEIF